MNLKEIQPLILTCERETSYISQTLKSYKELNLTEELLPVIFCIDENTSLSSEYLKTLDSVNNYKIVVKDIRPRTVSYCRMILNMFEYALKTCQHETKYFLSLEDDIQFSSKFVESLEVLEYPKDAGFITLYSSGEEYFPDTKDFIYEINWERFYGTQAILFSRETLELLVNNKDEVTETIGLQDIQWKNFMIKKNYKIYATYNSYVQHIGLISGLHQNNFHYSTRFTK
jgi:hypothetical protein